MIASLLFVFSYLSYVCVGQRARFNSQCATFWTRIRSSLGWLHPAWATLRPPRDDPTLHTLFRKAVKQAQVQDVQAEREARRFAIFTRVAEVEAAPDAAVCAGLCGVEPTVVGPDNAGGGRGLGERNRAEHVREDRGGGGRDDGMRRVVLRERRRHVERRPRRI